ncbi:hypothetical protein OAM67_00865 [bacterium]|nr:hypothetical protein [bacterium]
MPQTRSQTTRAQTQKVQTKARVNKKYVPDSLNSGDRRKQLRSIRSRSPKARPLVKHPLRKSKWTTKFHKTYGQDADLVFIKKHLMDAKGVEQILAKGRGAYVSAGSRPNTNMHNWAVARLHSVLMGGPARKIDQQVYDAFAKKQLSGGDETGVVRMFLAKGPSPKKFTAKFFKGTKLVKTTHFGAAGYSDYTMHKDTKRKQRYINRHQKNENWNNYMSAGALSRYILWNKPTLQASLKDYKQQFNLA